MIRTAVSRAAGAAAPMCSPACLAAGGLAVLLGVLSPASRAQAPAIPVDSAPSATADPAPDAAPVNRLDPAHSRFGFELRTRWGQLIEGNFPRYEGTFTTLPDGRRQVRIRLATQNVEVSGSTRYARFARGPDFLDAARHPWVEFVSEPYVGELVHAGGPLRGTLSLHGVSRAETFTLKPSTCPRPAHDCDVVATGRVSRADYGLQTWRWAVQDEVRFTLRVRWKEAPL